MIPPSVGSVVEGSCQKWINMIYLTKEPDGLTNETRIESTKTGIYPWRKL
jgi:hypothetical protein